MKGRKLLKRAMSIQCLNMQNECVGILKLLEFAQLKKGANKTNNFFAN